MKAPFFALLCAAATSAWADLPTYLESHSGTGDEMQACVYSDQSVIEIKADAQCPPSNNTGDANGGDQLPDIDDDQTERDD